MNSPWSRRDFLDFLGRSASYATVASVLPLSSCARLPAAPSRGSFSFQGISPSTNDELGLAQGLSSKILLKWDDPLNAQGLRFGFNCDHLQWLPLSTDHDRYIFMVNHEYVHDLWVSGFTGRPHKKSRAQVDKEQQSVGVSLVDMRQTATGWEPVFGSKYNRRITAQTPIPMIAPRPIMGARTAIGTLGNCAGGKTPWGTFLTCEENTPDVYGYARYTSGKRRVELNEDGYALDWTRYYPHPPEHYGWVVEIHPLTGEAKKLTALGRFEHEGATLVTAKDGRAVVYMGDDKNNRCIYKFISDKPNSLETGTLYAADVVKGRWLALDITQSAQLQKHFKDQTEVLTRAHEAALMLGASEMDRPEDIEIDPLTGAVIVALTNNKAKGNAHGSLFKLMEHGNDPLAMTFDSHTLLAGGPDQGFSCPDNLVFDKRGNLWFTTDISGSAMNKGAYAPFGNNGLFVVPCQGPQAGQAIQMASAPNDAEFTGPLFSPDFRTLFLCVQHPGETTTDRSKPTSTWPHLDDNIPRPSLVAISGALLDRWAQG